MLVLLLQLLYGNGAGLTGIANRKYHYWNCSNLHECVKVGTAITLDATSGIITAVNGFVGPLW